MLLREVFTLLTDVCDKTIYVPTSHRLQRQDVNMTTWQSDSTPQTDNRTMFHQQTFDITAFRTSSNDIDVPWQNAESLDINFCSWTTTKIRQLLTPVVYSEITTSTTYVSANSHLYAGLTIDISNVDMHQLPCYSSHRLWTITLTFWTWPNTFRHAPPIFRPVERSPPRTSSEHYHCELRHTNTLEP